LTLSDDAARSLVQQLEPLRVRHPLMPGARNQHRPFVRDFVRAVYHATGSTYSAAFYRKLLKAYAPERTPSTPTIDTEKILLVQQLRARALPPTAAASSVDVDTAALPPSPLPVHPGVAAPSTDLALQQLMNLQHHTIALINALSVAPGTSSGAPGLQAHIDYLTNRLGAAESALTSTRSHAARIAAQLQEQETLATERAGQLATLQATIDAQAMALAAMAQEMTGTRQFMAQAVDGVRGETRAMRERCTYLEAQLKEKEQQTEMYRQMLFNKGSAPMPNKSGMLR
jgi:hypothetical protein